MRKPTSGVLAAALGLSLATLALGTAVPASAAPTHAPAPAHAHAHAHAPAAAAAPAASSVSAYAGSAEEAAGNKAFFEAVLKSVAEKRAAHPRSAAAVTVVYDASRAPSFSAEIARSTSIWNSSVTNVRLQSGTASTADFSYREGNSSQGSRPVSPPTRPAMCSGCPTTTRARAAS